MSMFSDLARGSDADDLAKRIKIEMEKNPQDKEYIEKYLYSYYRKCVDWAEGCHDRELENEISQLFSER